MYEMAEEPLLKRKLLLDGDGKGEDKRFQIFIKQLTKWIYSDELPSECEASCNRLLTQLHSIKLNRKKNDLTSRCYLQQMAKFKMIETTFEVKTEEIKKDIETQQNLFKRARVVKKNHVEYDLLVDTVNRHPCRKELKEKIENLRKEVIELQNERGNLRNKWNSKVKQSYVLSTSANALKIILKGENANLDGS